MVQVDEGDEEQEAALSLILEAPETKDSLMEMLSDLREYGEIHS